MGRKKGAKQKQQAAKVQQEKQQIQALEHKIKVVQQMARKSNGAVTGTKALANAIALPGSSPGLRMPTEDGPRTSVMVVKDQFTINSPTAGWNDFNIGDIVILYFGQPGRLMLMYQNVTQHNYLPQFVDSLTAGTTLKTIQGGWNILPKPITTTTAEATWWPLIGAVPEATSATNMHGPWLPAGLSDDVPYILLNAGDTISTPSATTWTGTGAGSLLLNLFMWAGPGVQPLRVDQQRAAVTAGNVGAVVLFTVASTGYYAVQFTQILLTSGTITSSNNLIYLRLATGTGGRWANRCMQDVDPKNTGDPVAAQSCRVNAASLLVSNTSSVLNRQGTVLAARMRIDNPLGISINDLRMAAERYSGDAALGCYTFKEFSKQAEDFTDCTGNGGGLVFHLDYSDYVHAIQITCPGYATGPNTYTVSCDAQVEFKTDVARYSKDVSRYSFPDLVAARKMLNSNPEWFYENPMHMSQIYGFIQNAAKKFYQGAVRVAPYAATMAGALQPDKAAAYQSLVHALRGLT